MSVDRSSSNSQRHPAGGRPWGWRGVEKRSFYKGADSERDPSAGAARLLPEPLVQIITFSSVIVYFTPIKKALQRSILPLRYQSSSAIRDTAALLPDGENERKRISVVSWPQISSDISFINQKIADEIYVLFLQEDFTRFARRALR